MLLVIRHFSPALAVVAGGILGACSVVLGAATGSPVFIVSGAMSVALCVARSTHRVRE